MGWNQARDQDIGRAQPIANVILTSVAATREGIMCNMLKVWIDANDYGSRVQGARTPFPTPNSQPLMRLFFSPISCSHVAVGGYRGTPAGHQYPPYGALYPIPLSYILYPIWGTITLLFEDQYVFSHQTTVVCAHHRMEPNHRRGRGKPVLHPVPYTLHYILHPIIRQNGAREAKRTRSKHVPGDHLSERAVLSVMCIRASLAAPSIARRSTV